MSLIEHKAAGLGGQFDTGGLPTCGSYSQHTCGEDETEEALRRAASLGSAGHAKRGLLSLETQEERRRGASPSAKHPAASAS